MSETATTAVVPALDVEQAAKEYVAWLRTQSPNTLSLATKCITEAYCTHEFTQPVTIRLMKENWIPLPDAISTAPPEDFRRFWRLAGQSLKQA